MTTMPSILSYLFWCCGIVKLKKIASLFSNLKTVLEKKHIKLEVELDTEVEPHFRILK